jgi:hypothetical protein
MQPEDEALQAVLERSIADDLTACNYWIPEVDAASIWDEARRSFELTAGGAP